MAQPQDIIKPEVLKRWLEINDAELEFLINDGMPVMQIGPRQLFDRQSVVMYLKTKETPPGAP